MGGRKPGNGSFSGPPRTVGAGKLADFFVRMAEAGYDPRRLAFLCIGTDRSTGDALGPLVGMLLENAGYPHVIGTLRHPCDSENIVQRLSEIPEHCQVVAVDSCVGKSIGLFQVAAGPLEPGKALGKSLPPIGDFSVRAIVCAEGGNPYRMLQSASLYQVWRMAESIADAVKRGLPLNARPPKAIGD